MSNECVSDILAELDSVEAELLIRKQFDHSD